MKFTLPEPEFIFAGFTFPKWVWTLPKGADIERACDTRHYRLELLRARAEARKHQLVGPYYHTPRPGVTGQGGWTLPMRWEYCDEIADIDHTGWYCDDEQVDKLRGVVIRLPKQRGFLAGWTMGKGMTCKVDTAEIYYDETEAAYAADSLAENDANTHREQV